MGNCGVGVAPVRPKSRDIVMWDLVNVEAIPFDVMQRGIDWQWETHAQYLDVLQKRGMGINIASIAALTPLRHYVIGEESRVGRRAEESSRCKSLSRCDPRWRLASVPPCSITIGFRGRPLACQRQP
jgi:N-acyl-D-aspartate/D-glutamate deacylase